MIQILTIIPIFPAIKEEVTQIFKDIQTVLLIITINPFFKGQRIGLKDGKEHITKINLTPRILISRDKMKVDKLEKEEKVKDKVLLDKRRSTNNKQL